MDVVQIDKLIKLNKLISELPEEEKNIYERELKNILENIDKIREEKRIKDEYILKLNENRQKNFQKINYILDKKYFNFDNDDYLNPKISIY